MNLLSSFNDFYGNLSSFGLFFFWIVIFLFVFLIVLSIVLVMKNKKLSKLLEEESVSDDVSIDIVEESDKEEEIVKIEDIKEEVKEEIKVEESTKMQDVGPYKKNVLREMSSRMQTSPINIERKENNNITYVKESLLDEDFSGLDLRDDSLSPLETMEDNYEINDNMKFASEIVERMEEEIKPSNIELTDYEKKQEEEAIISYDELLKVKDKIYNITEDEETEEFIDELKSFRLDLQ